jgi:hypothetical protein
MCAAWSEIKGKLCFYKFKTEEAKRGGKSAIQPILCCQLSITVVSTPPSSMLIMLIQGRWAKNQTRKSQQGRKNKKCYQFWLILRISPISFEKSFLGSIHNEVKIFINT